MKSFKILFFIGLLMLTKMANAQDDQYKLTIKLKHIQPNAKAYFVKSFGWPSQEVLDSAVFKNRTVQFTGAITEPYKVSLVIAHLESGNAKWTKESDEATFYLENGHITVTGTDLAKTSKIKGGPVNKDNELYKEKVTAKQKERLKVVQDMLNTTPKELQNKEFFSSLMKKNDEITVYTNGLNREFIAAHPNSYVSFDLVKQITRGDYVSTPNVELFKQLSPAIQNTPDGKMILEVINKQEPFSVGKIAPDFTQNDVNNKPVKLSDFKGKYVLLDFWASWCTPCRAENPIVVKAYENYKAKNFTVLGVSLDNPGKKEAWLEAIKKDGLSWTQVSDLKGWKNEVAQLYQVRSVPHNLLIGPDGKILARNLRGDALEAHLAKLIK